MIVEHFDHFIRNIEKFRRKKDTMSNLNLLSVVFVAIQQAPD